MMNASDRPLAARTVLMASVAILASASASAQVAPQPQITPSIQTGMPATPAAVEADKPWAPPADFSEWRSGIKLSAQLDAGIVINPQAPRNSTNFGQLFTDKANRPILNSLLLTAERAIDPKATDYDFGFKLQGLYGSDARIVHSLGLFDHAIHDRNQIDVLEANVTAHTPWLFSGGIDFKAGIYPTPLGFEVIDPKANPFYSHSYIFNYGLPFKHFGILSTSHVTDVVDIYFGIDSGTNTTIGRGGDNNNRPAGIAGIGLNLLGGNLTILALTHIGPEDSLNNAPSFANSAERYFNDIVLTYKYTDALSFTTELNYVKEEGFRAEGYGAAQYASYNISDTVTLNGRAEVWRDNTNFFVNNPVGSLDYVLSQRGKPSNFYVSQRPTTYSEFTVGATWKPTGLPEQISTFMVRPELRYDRALAGGSPFDDQRNRGSVTLAADVVIGF